MVVVGHIVGFGFVVGCCRGRVVRGRLCCGCVRGGCGVCSGCGRGAWGGCGDLFHSCGVRRSVRSCLVVVVVWIVVAVSSALVSWLLWWSWSFAVIAMV